MKIYHNTTKRIAKKKIGKGWKKILCGATLKPGDLVSTCKGYNERIQEIIPCWTGYKLSRGLYISDFDIVTEVGSSCSLVSCCSFPLETKEEVIRYWDWYNSKDGREWLEHYKDCIILIDQVKKISQAILEGREVFDEDGQPLEEFCHEYEKVRFNRKN